MAYFTGDILVTHTALGFDFLPMTYTSPPNFPLRIRARFANSSAAAANKTKSVPAVHSRPKTAARPAAFKTFFNIFSPSLTGINIELKVKIVHYKTVSDVGHTLADFFESALFVHGNRAAVVLIDRQPHGIKAVFAAVSFQKFEHLRRVPFSAVFLFNVQL